MKTSLGGTTKKWQVYGAALFTVLLWGSSFPAVRYTLRTYSPEALMLLRFLSASITLIIIGLVNKIRLPEKKDLPLFGLGGFVGIFLYMLLSKNGAVHIEAGIGSFIVSSSPVFVLIMATLILKEKVRRACWFGVAVSFVGLIVVMVSQTTGLTPNIGVLLFILATIATSLHSIILRKITRTYTAIEATTYSIVFATILMLIYTPNLIRELPGSDLVTNLLTVYLGGFVGIFLYMLLSKNGAVHIEAGIGSFIVSSSPVFVLILATLLLKEKVRRACWFGVAVSFVGLIVVMVSQTTGLTPNIGVLLFILAAIITSMHSIIQRKITRTYTAIEAITYSIIIATIIMLIYTPNLIREIPGSDLSANIMAIYLGIFPAALAYLSWSWAISKAEKTTYVTVFLYLSPLITSTLAYFWLGETLSAMAILGGILVIAGMVITNIVGRK